MTTTPKQPICPDVSVGLGGADGNAIVIIGRVLRAMRIKRVNPDVMEAFLAESKSGDYDHLLQTCMKYVEVY